MGLSFYNLWDDDYSPNSFLILMKFSLSPKAP